MKPLTMILILGCLLLVACKKQLADAPGNKQQINVRVKTCVPIDSVGSFLQICMDSVIENRCSIGTNCVWEGVAKVNFTLDNGRRRLPFSLYTLSGRNAMFPNSINLDGLTIALDSLNGYPAINVRNDYNRYEASLSISR